MVMKDTKSSVVNKKLDEESIELRDMAREHIQKHETSINRKKMNPVESLRWKKVEQRMTTKEQTVSKVDGQHRVKKADEEV